MIDTLWVDARYLLGGVVCFDENIVYNARGSKEIYRYRFNDTFHITLDINCMRSQRTNRTRTISSHSQNKFTCLYSS